MDLSVAGFEQAGSHSRAVNWSGCQSEQVAYLSAPEDALPKTPLTTNAACGSEQVRCIDDRASIIITEQINLWAALSNNNIYRAFQAARPLLILLLPGCHHRSLGAQGTVLLH